MIFFLKLAYFLCTGAILITCWAYYSRRSNVENNKRIALKWFEDMDVQWEEQRYRGSRSTIVLDFGSGKAGSGGYKLMAGCKTQSGRAYYLSITSSFCVVTDWWILQAAPADFDAEIASSQPHKPALI